ALAGFTALGRAQATYWGAVQSSPMLAPAPPAPGDFLHQTSLTITPYSGTSCNSTPVYYYVGDTIQCTATVTDTYGSNFHTPVGNVNWTIGSNPIGSCSLQPVDGQTAKCDFQYTWQSADAGVPKVDQLQATYVATSSNHNSSSRLPG